jgi:hypothetical protein
MLSVQFSLLARKGKHGGDAARQRRGAGNGEIRRKKRSELKFSTPFYAFLRHFRLFTPFLAGGGRSSKSTSSKHQRNFKLQHPMGSDR